jgi:hypothetical protein
MNTYIRRQGTNSYIYIHTHTHTHIHISEGCDEEEEQASTYHENTPASSQTDHPSISSNEKVVSSDEQIEHKKDSKRSSAGKGRGQSDGRGQINSDQGSGQINSDQGSGQINSDQGSGQIGDTYDVIRRNKKDFVDLVPAWERLAKHGSMMVKGECACTCTCV